MQEVQETLAKPSLPPKAVGDVGEGAVVLLTVEALVGGGLLQRTEVADVGADLDVVEVALVDDGGHTDASRVPRHLQLGVFFMDVLCQQVDPLGVGIATHEGDAGDVGLETADKVVDGSGVEWQSDVVPQVVAMAPRTAARAARDVDSERHLIGDFLEDDVGVDIFKHERRSGGQPPPAAAARSSTRASGSR